MKKGLSLSKVEAALVFHWKPKLLRPRSLRKVEAAFGFQLEAKAASTFQTLQPWPAYNKL